jgi:hypothetical protein
MDGFHPQAILLDFRLCIAERFVIRGRRVSPVRNNYVVIPALRDYRAIG